MYCGVQKVAAQNNLVNGTHTNKCEDCANNKNSLGYWPTECEVFYMLVCWYIGSFDTVGLGAQYPVSTPVALPRADDAWAYGGNTATVMC